jgi:hypothetical protein
VAELSVLAVIALLNVALIEEPTVTTGYGAVATVIGDVVRTVGGVSGAGEVKKLHWVRATPWPARSWAPVEIWAEYKVLYARLLWGVKIATLPAQATVPVTFTGPGAASVKVVAGDVSVEQSIASLKVAVSTWLMGTPMALFTGTTVTVGGGVIVVNVHT